MLPGLARSAAPRLFVQHLIRRRALSITTSRSTSPSKPVMTSPPAHQVFATTNFSVSGASGLYDRARPSYPEQAIESILSRLPTPASPTDEGALIVELGAGTGLFTRGLLAALLAPSSPYRGRVKKVLAVEPSEGMRVGFEKGLQKEGWVRGDEGKGVWKKEGEGLEVEIVDGTFEKIPVGEGEADLAFHWVGHSGGAAVSEIGRVLKPGAAWCKIWNLEDRGTEWVKQLRDKYEKFEEGTPQYRHNYWQHIWDLPSFTSLFSLPEEHQKYYRSLPTTDDLVVDRVFSKSYITALSEEQRSELEKEMREVVKKGEGKEWIDEKEGVFAYPYDTDLFTTIRN
ncbi:hypothetical protein JCM11251_005623 [Rhodosporidiobolus azoricus]